MNIIMDIIVPVSIGTSIVLGLLIASHLLAFIASSILNPLGAALLNLYEKIPGNESKPIILSKGLPLDIRNSHYDPTPLSN